MQSFLLVRKRHLIYKTLFLLDLGYELNLKDDCW